MVGRLRSFFRHGGFRQLPWKNSWFSLAAFTAALSAGLLVSDLGTGKTRVGIPLPSIPIFEKPGSLAVHTATPGATVQLDNQPAQPGPARFPGVPVGAHRVTVAAPGYDAMTRTIEIKEATPASLDFSPLTRSSGGLDIVTIPARAAFTLKGAAADNTQEQTGHSPMDFASLPADRYELTVNSPRNGSQTVQLQISPHRTTTETVDLIRAADVAGADPAVARALLGQADVSTLDDAGKKQYAERLNQEIPAYTRAGAFAQASDALARLKNLGQDTQAQERDLADARDGYQQKIAGQVKADLAQGELGAARTRLKAAQENAPPQTADALQAQFHDQLAPYDQQIDAAIQTAAKSSPADGYDQLQTLADQHPDDVEVALAAARQLTLQPPNRAQISRELARLKEFDPQSLPSDDAGALQATIARFQAELAAYDRLHAAVDAETRHASSGNSAARVAALEREIARDEASIRGASSVNHTVDNFTTGLFHTHVRVVDVSAKEAEIDRDKQRLRQIEAAQASPGTISPAQRDLNAFSATVPW